MPVLLTPAPSVQAACLGDMPVLLTPAPSVQAEACGTDRLLKDSRVRLVGLKKKAENNGREGSILGFSNEKERYEVQLMGGSITKVKRANLELIRAPRIELRSPSRKRGKRRSPSRTKQKTQDRDRLRSPRRARSPSRGEKQRKGARSRSRKRPCSASREGLEKKTCGRAEGNKPRSKSRSRTASHATGTKVVEKSDTQLKSSKRSRSRTASHATGTKVAEKSDAQFKSSKRSGSRTASHATGTKVAEKSDTQFKSSKRSRSRTASHATGTKVAEKSDTKFKSSKRSRSRTASHAMGTKVAEKSDSQLKSSKRSRSRTASHATPTKVGDRAEPDVKAKRSRSRTAPCATPAKVVDQGETKVNSTKRSRSEVGIPVAPMPTPLQKSQIPAAVAEAAAAVEAARMAHLVVAPPPRAELSCCGGDPQRGTPHVPVVVPPPNAPCSDAVGTPWQQGWGQSSWSGKGCGRGGGRGGGSFRDIQISKALSRVLRHTAVTQGLAIRNDGFCAAADLLALPEFRSVGCTLDEVRMSVRDNDKKRFELREEDGVTFIRAAQGHSMKQVEDDQLLNALHASSDNLPPVCVHGTYRKNLESIKAKGLIAGGGMSQRKHVHFAPYEPGDGRIISGMRYNCEIAVYVDLPAALRDGVPFFCSSNNVILSPGVQGVVPAKFISKIKDLQSGEWL